MEMELERSNRGKLQADMDKLRAFYDSKLESVDGQLADLPPTSAGKEHSAVHPFGGALDRRVCNLRQICLKKIQFYRFQS